MDGKKNSVEAREPGSENSNRKIDKGKPEIPIGMSLEATGAMDHERFETEREVIRTILLIIMAGSDTR